MFKEVVKKNIKIFICLYIFIISEYKHNKKKRQVKKRKSTNIFFSNI